MNDLEKYLAEVEARANAATPGPIELWAGTGFPPYIKWPIIQKGANVYGYPEEQDWIGSFKTSSDQDFYAHARTDIPKLIATVRDIQHDNDDMQIFVDAAVTDCVYFISEVEKLRSQLAVAVKALEYIREDGSTHTGQVVNHSAIKADKALAEMSSVGLPPSGAAHGSKEKED